MKNGVVRIGLPVKNIAQYGIIPEKPTSSSLMKKRVTESSNFPPLPSPFTGGVGDKSAFFLVPVFTAGQKRCYGKKISVQLPRHKGNQGTGSNPSGDNESKAG